MRMQNKGITLIALVVTIIVLMILASISINILLGNNGIITRAKQAVTMQEIAQIKEEIQLAVIVGETDYRIDESKTKVKLYEDAILTWVQGSDIPDRGNSPVEGTVARNGKLYDFTVNVETGDIVNVEESAPIAVESITLDKASMNLGIETDKLVSNVNPNTWDTNKVMKVNSSDGKTVPVPTGYVASTVTGENSVEGGFVIKQGSNGAATSGVNEYVWIPVPDVTVMYTTNAGSPQGTLKATVLPENAKNKRVTYSSSNESVVTVDSSGKVTAVGVGTATITATTVDGGKTATCTITVANASEVSITGATGVRTTRYSASGIVNDKKGNPVKRGLPSSTESREPGVASDYSLDGDTANRRLAGFTKIIIDEETGNETTETMSLAEMAQVLVDEYNEMLESVATYGGFYIGRYELSNSGTQKEIIPSSNTKWYNLYKKCKDLSMDETKAKVRMIWGCQWDVVCNFIAEGGYNTETDSSKWGNYISYNTAEPKYESTDERYIASSNLSKKKVAGFSEYWKAKNIYDFAGNVVEWTQVVNYYNNRELRGGEYSCTGSFYPASYNSEWYPNSPDPYMRFTPYTLCNFEC